MGYNLGWSQNIIVKGTIKDIENHPVSGARIYFLKNEALKVRSDKNGVFYIPYQRFSYDSLKIEHIAYLNKSIPITKKTEKRIKNDTLSLNLILEFKTLLTVDVVIKEQKPDTVFGSQDYSVEDFEFDKNGNLLLLTYDKNLDNGAELKLIGVDNAVLSRFKIPTRAIELQKDFRGNIHLITKGEIYFVEIENRSLAIYLEDREYYYRFVAPIIDTLEQYIYFSNYSDLYPAFDYWEYARTDSVYKKMITVIDEVMMEMYRAEFKYVDNRTKIWAHQKQLETGIDKEIWVGATYFTNSIYYEPLYAPMYKKGDSILIFDHYKDHLFIYKPLVGIVDSARINYHKDAGKNGWEQPLIQDKGNGKVYAYFVRAGYTYLYEIDLATGQIKDAFKLYYKYVERIQIINNKVYYIYRPFETIQKKYIYSELLK